MTEMARSFTVDAERGLLVNGEPFPYFISSEKPIRLDPLDSGDLFTLTVSMVLDKGETRREEKWPMFRGREERDALDILNAKRDRVDRYTADEVDFEWSQAWLQLVALPRPPKPGPRALDWRYRNEA